MSATITAVTVPIRHFYVCACCLTCGVDPEMALSDEATVCPTCGHPCSCPGCLAEHESTQEDR